MNQATLLPLARITLSIAIIFLVASGATATETTVVAEGQYVMADGDTLAVAENKVLQRAQRKAVEEAGIYLESAFHDYEAVRNGKSMQVSSLEIRTLAAAITKTDVLESRHSFEHDRPVFTIRIRAVVNLDHLQEAVRRWRSEEQLAAHFKQLQRENAELKAQLRETHTALRSAHACDRATRAHRTTGTSAPPRGKCRSLAQPSSENRSNLTSCNAGPSVRRSIDCQGTDLSKDGFSGPFQQVSPKRILWVHRLCPNGF